MTSVLTGRKAAQNADDDVAKLTTYFFRLVTMLHDGPLQNAEACTPALRRRDRELS